MLKTLVTITISVHKQFIHLFIHSFTGAYSPGRTFGLPFRGFFITHIQTNGRTPLDESERLPTQDNTTYKHNRQTSMPRVGFEHAPPATKRSQTDALDRAATGLGFITSY
jgi:hypothetical protein